MTTLPDLISTHLSRLESRASEWGASGPKERIAAAREVLEALHTAPWDATYVPDECALYGIEPSLDAAGASAAAASRMVLGSLVGDWLNTFIAGACDTSAGKKKQEGGEEKERRDARIGLRVGPSGEKVHGPHPLGPAAPGHAYELWTCGPSSSSSSSSSFSSSPPSSSSSSAAAAPASDAGFRRTSTERRWLGRPTEDGGGGGNGGGGGACPGAAPAVCLVLGAGNQSFLTLLDALDWCLVHRQCVLVKLHPLRPFLLKPYEALLGALAARGVMAVVPDDAVPDKTALVADRRIGHVHLTGSEATAAAVRAALDAAGKASASITAELGCATPWLVVPSMAPRRSLKSGTGGQPTDDDDDDWTTEELKHAATLIAVAKKSNGGSNCLAAQVVVVPSGWARKADFLDLLEVALKEQPTCPAYYPGCKERRDQVAEVARRAGAPCKVVRGPKMQLGRCSLKDTPTSAGAQGDGSRDDVVLIECGCACPGGVPTTLAESGPISPRGGVPPRGVPEAVADAVLRSETFGPVLAVVELPFGDDGDEKEEQVPGQDQRVGKERKRAQAWWAYLDRLAAFANGPDLYGSLSCSVLAPAAVLGPSPATGATGAASAAGSAPVSATAADAAGSGRPVPPSEGVERLLGSLEYGCVGLNAWTVLGYVAACKGGTWGAHPDEPGAHSGCGALGNHGAHAVQGAVKTVLRGPPLATKPLMDNRAPPPALLFDALHAGLCAPSPATGALRVAALLTARAGQALVAWLPGGLGRWLVPDRRYGAAA